MYLRLSQTIQANFAMGAQTSSDGPFWDNLKGDNSRRNLGYGPKRHSTQKNYDESRIYRKRAEYGLGEYGFKHRTK